MATRSQQRAAFLTANPWCAFCGGQEPATTVEHCPPKSLFQFKNWPEGFEFPACLSCNKDSADQDAVIAMLARIHADEMQGNADNRMVGLMLNINKQFPGVIGRMVPSHIEARQRNRKLGIKPGPGQLHQDVAPVNVPDEIQLAVGTFAGKLSKAVYYREAGQVFPAEGSIVMRWFTNIELLRRDEYPLFEHFMFLAGTSPLLTRGGKHLNDQFEFKLSLSEDQQVFLLQSRIGKSFGMVLFGSTKPGVLEPGIQQLQENYQSDSPFIVLQSAIGA